MRLSQRLIAATVVVALSVVLAGCSNLGSNFDPSDLLDFLDTKKKLPGERKPVFPDGVPGLEQGVPKDLYKGSAQEQLDQQNAAQAAAAAPPPVEEPKPKKGQEDKAAGPSSSGCGAGACGGRRPQCADRSGRRSRSRAAAAQAQEDRPQAHHRAAAGSADRTTCAAAGCSSATTISRAIPGAVAEQYFPALIRFAGGQGNSPAFDRRPQVIGANLIAG